MPGAPEPKLVVSRLIASSQGLLCPKIKIYSRGIEVLRNIEEYGNILKTTSMCHSMCRSPGRYSSMVSTVLASLWESMPSLSFGGMVGYAKEKT